MSRLFMFVFALLAFTVPALAQETTTGAGGGFVLPVAFAMAIASGLCGLGQGKALASATEAIARNPSAGGAIRGALILGLAFIESLALFTLVIIFAR